MVEAPRAAPENADEPMRDRLVAANALAHVGRASST